MKHSSFFAFFTFLALLCAACSNMGGGSDPAITEGVFSFYLPPEISFDNPESEGTAADAEAENEGEDAEASAAASHESDAENAAPADATLAPASGEDEGANAEEGASAVEGEGLEDAPSDESDEGEDAESASPAAPPAAVARWFVSLVSAMGFERHEIIAPSEEPVLFTVQAGQWKILVIAEDAEGQLVARCELNGVSLSPEEEKPVPLEWQLLESL